MPLPVCLTLPLVLHEPVAVCACSAPLYMSRKSMKGNEHHPMHRVRVSSSHPK
jgi:hypothetical protein